MMCEAATLVSVKRSPYTRQAVLAIIMTHPVMIRRSRKGDDKKKKVILWRARLYFLRHCRRNTRARNTWLHACWWPLPRHQLSASQCSPTLHHFSSSGQELPPASHRSFNMCCWWRRVARCSASELKQAVGTLPHNRLCACDRLLERNFRLLQLHNLLPR